MSNIRRYDLQPLEDDYRKLTALGDSDAGNRLMNILRAVRYDLRMSLEVLMEYRDGMDEPMVMRILKTEKDLDRWISQRFGRLEEFG